ncbi:MAG: hypothetical protein U0840_26785 [Gemmataceae bacterium]
MAEKDVSRLPLPSTEDQQVAARNFEYANRATVGGDLKLAVQLLQTCCRLVPSNLAYRQALRKAAKTRYKNNKRGSGLAPLSTLLPRYRLGRARQAGQYRNVLIQGEAILALNPWDRGTLIAMSEAAAALDLPVLAVWLLQDAREAFPRDHAVNRALARLLEQQKHFTQAINLWEMIRRDHPQDLEAREKVRQLAVSDTLARSNLEEATAEALALSTDTGHHKAAVASPTPAPATPGMTPVEKRTAYEVDLHRERLGKEPGNPDPYLQLAALEVRKGHLEQAQTILKQGLEATHGAVPLQLALADLEIEPYRRKLARTEQQLASAPADEALHRTRDKLLSKIDKLEVDLFRKKADLDPADRAVRLELGIRLFRSGKVQEAVVELQNARAEPRLHWNAVLNLGHCFRALDNWPLARRNFEDALKHLPPGEEAHRKDLLFQLASGNAEAGDFERAVELGLDLADLDYSYRNIGQLLETWQTRLREPGHRSVRQP